MSALPEAFMARPFAHRALHNSAKGVVENSRAAVRAACEAGYAIELDVQCSADGRAMVFHDERLERLTEGTGFVRARTCAELGQTPLRQSGGEGVPSLEEICALIGGRVPLVVEIKDQDGALGKSGGVLEADVARVLAGYGGAVAVMSFNPHSMVRMRGLLPAVARGLVSCDFAPQDWETVPSARLDELRALPDLSRCGASFVSHQWRDLARVRELRASGLPILCWTVRSPAQEAEARQGADQITFEGYGAL